MNYPFPIYPNGILSGYTSYSRYLCEVLRLYEFLSDLVIKIQFEDIKNLIILNIGSAGEDAIYFIKKNPAYIEESENCQWRQIHPVFIEHFINKFKNNLNINVIVVSPDSYQEDIDYIPMFVQKYIITDDFILNYTIENNQKYTYHNKDANVAVEFNFFNCFMPNIEKNKNKIALHNKLIKDTNSIYEINNFTQTVEDLEFIQIFYEKIEEIFTVSKNHNNYLIILNFATFRNTFVPSEAMFCHIIKLIRNYNVVFFEWNNFKNNVILTSSNPSVIDGISCYNKKIKYCSSSTYDKDDIIDIFK